MSTNVHYPLTSLHFVVSWQDSQDTGNFSEVSGLTMEREVVEYRGGKDPAPYVTKVPGLKKFGNVTLKRGIVPAEYGNGLFEWYATPPSGDRFRRDVVVSLCNEEGTPVMTWKIQEAWVVKVEGPSLKSTGTDIALESLEFACASIAIEVA